MKQPIAVFPGSLVITSDHKRHIAEKGSILIPPEFGLEDILEYTAVQFGIDDFRVAASSISNPQKKEHDEHVD